MKHKRYIHLLAITAIIPIATSVKSAVAIGFTCGKTSDGFPATVAQTSRGNVPVIRWVSNYFRQSGYNPQTLCQMVSRRLQTENLF